MDVKGVLDRAAAALLNTVYPSACPDCGGPPDSFAISPICRGCWDGISPYEGPRCVICAEPFTSAYAEVCGACLSRNAPPVSWTLCFGIYSDTLREAIHQFKFHSQRRLARPLAALLARLDIPESDGMVPVPQSVRGLRERGFSQTHLLARALSRARGIPVRAGLLYKKRETLPQVGLPRAERLRNLRGAFGTRQGLNGEKLLVIDDVITTGATVRECAKTLLKAGAGEVLAMSIARSENL
jgi:ComF family protein